ncbi:hypothetical protein BGZ76_007459 [Entomortierella beljakovae]|nr:hypothetical protein BGZ76_007459 [Entomortierella beljakovae]
MSNSPAPKPLPPLNTIDPRDFYTVVVSSESFLLTQSAIEYDSPNFFSEIFLNRNRDEYRTRFMYINRNPEVFRDIVKHLQGYYVAARDEVHLENLVLDAHFYKLNRLVEYINVGGTLFKISRETINKDSPNFFSLLTPYADRNLTPTFFCRSPELFNDILSHLRGYEIEIRDRVHRENLLKEARYFKLNGLIQKLSLGTDFIYSGFPTNPEERVKPEVTMVLKNIKIKHVLVKGWREYKEPTPRYRAFDGDFMFTASTSIAPSSEGNDSGDLKQSSERPSVNDAALSVAKESILQFNKTLIELETLQDLLYKPTSDATPMALVIELSSIELYAIWLGSVNASLLGDQHLFVYREQDLANLNKICKHLGLKSLSIAANVVKLSPHVYFELDGQTFKGQEELQTIILKLALSSAKVVPPGRTLRVFLSRALVRMGCKSGELVMTIIKAEGWSSDKEYNASRKYLTDDTREFIL